MSNIDHILLYLILFASFYLWSESDTKKKYINGIIAVIIFTFVVGSRTWGPDYEWYNYKVDHPNDLLVKEDEIGFQFLNTCIRHIGLNGDYAFYIYALLLIIGVSYIIYSYPKNWKYMCIFVIPAILLETSIHIRQGIAFGIALIALAFINKAKWKLSILYGVIAFSIHKIIIIFFLIYGLAYLLSNKKIPLPIILILYTISTFIPQIININQLVPFISNIEIGGKYDSYIENSERWFSNESNNEEWQQGYVALILSYIYDIAMFVIIDLYLKKENNQNIRSYYYTFVIGAIFVRFFFLNELLRRIFSLPYMLYFIPLGFSISYLTLNKHLILNKKESTLFKCFYYTLYLYIFLYWGRFIFLNKDCNFLWT